MARTESSGKQNDKESSQEFDDVLFGCWLDQRSRSELEAIAQMVSSRLDGQKRNVAA